MRNSVSIYGGLPRRPRGSPIHIVFVHARVARFDGLLYAITLPGSQSASLSVRFENGTPSPHGPLLVPVPRLRRAGLPFGSRASSGNFYRCNVRRIPHHGNSATVFNARTTETGQRDR